MNLIGNYTCHCPSGLTGRHCTDDINECNTPNHCEHNGVCTNSHGSFKCRCPPQWLGTRCTNDRNECDNWLEGQGSSACLNGGRCFNFQGGYNCSCLAQYEGDRCEKHKCSNVTCLNDGECKVTHAHTLCVALVHYIHVVPRTCMFKGFRWQQCCGMCLSYWFSTAADVKTISMIVLRAHVKTTLPVWIAVMIFGVTVLLVMKVNDVKIEQMTALKSHVFTTVLVMFYRRALVMDTSELCSITFLVSLTRVNIREYVNIHAEIITNTTFALFL